MTAAARDQLIELFSQQMGVPSTQCRALLDQGPQAMLDVFAHRLGEANPVVAAMTAAFADRRAEAPSEPVLDVEARPRLDDDVRRLGRQLRRLERELTAACQLLGDVAAVLGACPACFGSNPDCAHCRGHGAPGSSPTDDPEVLREWLVRIASRSMPARVRTRGENFTR